MTSDPLQIAVAVVTHGDHVLVGRRDAHAKHAAGLHEFPGGKVEPGESPAAAAIRETREETGLSIRIGPLLDRTTSQSPSGPIELFFFAAEPVDPAAGPRAPFTWVAIPGLAELDFPPANAAVIRQLEKAGLARRQSSA
ncbi:MAG: (deoxy)nucleoside triphosphate pyrophosphohydrolase [Planctomycetia bacterium]